MRILVLQPTSPRQRGKMTIDQMLEHCARGIDMATGTLVIPRVFLGYILGGIFKQHILKDEPIGQGRPTATALVTTAEHFDIEAEKQKLIAKIESFLITPQEQVAKSIHPFFGALTAEQWGVQMWKHLDHHLKQFGG